MKKKIDFKVLLQLFIDYFKIGLFTFGGGLSMIALIEKTFVEKRKYISHDELLDIVSIAEATPGVIAVNTATYIGYKVMGFLGSLFSTIAVSLPSFIIITIITIFYDKFINIEVISYIIKGIMLAVTFLIFRAGVKIYKKYKKNALAYFLISLSFILCLLNKFLSLNISSIYIVLAGGLISLLIFLFTRDKKEAQE